MSNATIHIDGALALHSLRITTLDAPGLMNDAHLFFRVRAGIQEHPVWAYGRLAIVVFCYTHVARLHTGDLSGVLEITLDGTLISSGAHTNVLAKSVHWHTSSAIRRVAERLVAEVIAGSAPPEIFGEMQVLPNPTPSEVHEAIEKSRLRRASR
jgi:hypothetical protein